MTLCLLHLAIVGTTNGAYKKPLSGQNTAIMMIPRTLITIIRDSIISSRMEVYAVIMMKKIRK